jgi:hypothetical protein
MEGTIAPRKLTGPRRSALRFTFATEADDPAIRRLLRENPIVGKIRLTFEREPDYFMAHGIVSEDQTIVAFDEERLLCMGRCSIRECFLNGTPARVGYLSELRLDQKAQGRFDILRRGYKFFRDAYSDNPPELWFTSIAADNERSIRFLERRLPGMPLYTFLSEFVTALLPVPRRGNFASNSTGIRFIPGSETLVDRIADFLNRNAAHHQLPTYWAADALLSLNRLGLRLENFILMMKGETLLSCAALWDQRSFRQIVIRGYSPQFGLLRPFLNAFSSLTGNPRLPKIGATLAQAFVSPLAISEPQFFAPLLQELRTLARRSGIDLLTLGFPLGDHCLKILRDHFHTREYHSRLYAVSWRDKVSTQFNSISFWPDIAFL